MIAKPTFVGGGKVLVFHLFVGHELILFRFHASASQGMSCLPNVLGSHKYHALTVLLVRKIHQADGIALQEGQCHASRGRFIISITLPRLTTNLPSWGSPCSYPLSASRRIHRIPCTRECFLRRQLMLMLMIY